MELQPFDKQEILTGIVSGYVEAIYFTEGDSVIHSNDDMSPDADQKVLEDCTAFLDNLLAKSEQKDWDKAFERFYRNNEFGEHLGHDFWLTRNRHGAGFWDGDWPESFGELAAKISHEAGETCVYSDENCLVHFE